MVTHYECVHVTHLSAVEEAVSMIWIALVSGNVITEVTASPITGTKIMAFSETLYRHMVVKCLTLKKIKDILLLYIDLIGKGLNLCTCTSSMLLTGHTPP